MNNRDMVGANPLWLPSSFDIDQAESLRLTKNFSDK